MSEFSDLEARLADQGPEDPRPDLRDELLGAVHRELHSIPLARFAVAAGLLIAALIGIQFEETGHRLRVAAILGRGSTPRVERAIGELAPYLSSAQLAARFRLDARRESDRRWARYMAAQFEAGANHG
jgi:hypothetical protein